jgi:hypothetical protein
MTTHSWIILELAIFTIVVAMLLAGVMIWAWHNWR